MNISKAEQIRASLRALNNPAASNREIADKCEQRYGYKPSPSMIYETLGTESGRQLEVYNGKEMAEVKKTCRKVFAMDFDRFAGAVNAARAFHV